ncbi:putative kelch-type beta propeller [Helianthus annuus]|nr:putative kelch-type beta propeller [Helianthus annuus]KAJ0746781.1 putative kelch-type beta propeller [Helianthus annuus]
MGSFASSSRLPIEEDEDSPQLHLVYASFSAKTPSPDVTELNWIECYNPASNKWHRITSIPLAKNHDLKGYAMVIVGDFIYIIGGLCCRKQVREGHDYDDHVIKDDLQVHQHVLRYSILDDTWSTCSPLKQPRFDFACAVSGDKIYVAGGKSTTSGVRAVSSAEVYDPALDEWKLLPDMTTSRYKCVGVTWQDKFYAVGGFADLGATKPLGPFSMARSSAEVYDTLTNTWQFLPRMWELDVPPNQIVVVGGKLFSSGDCYKKWKGYIEKYDGDLNMWNVVDGSSLSSPTSMLDVTSPKRPLMEPLYLTIAPIGTCLYFFAGYRMIGETSKYMSEVHVFNTAGYGGDWMSFEPKMEDGEKVLSCHCCVYKRHE